MKTSPSLVAALLLCFSITAAAQKRNLFLHLKSGALKTTTIVSAAQIDSFNKHAATFKNKRIAVLQFEHMPAADVKKALAFAGIELLEYVPEYAYVVSISGKLQANLLQKWGVRTIAGLTAKQKMHPALIKTAQARFGAKAVEVQLTFPKAFRADDVTTALSEKHIPVLSSKWGAYRVLSVRIAANRLEELAALPFVLYMQPERPKDQPLNHNSRVASRGYLLNQSAADGGRGLTGAGVVMGIGDNGDVQFHADFSGRLINRAIGPSATHATHVHGTAAGAGIITEQNRGYAPKATIISQDYSGILEYAPVYVQDYGMVVTNNSYGVVGGCDYAGTYDVYSYILDQQAFDHPHLQHVFAAGNSGTDVCAPYSQGYHTVLGSYQTAKNVLTVGNTTYAGVIASNSSRGPVTDGRIKPEITAMGEAVRSSVPTNTYGNNWGTSMAAPAVSGGLALLYQRYRQLHSNADPKNGLMKALLCNGATDKGTTGPDYIYGFGFLNLERSVAMLENNQNISSSITNGGTNTHTITVPANTVQLKVMLYWNDPPPAIISGNDLVNDLDLRVVNSSAFTTYPKVLNPASVASAAIEGEDHINNIEQVVIDNPTAGTYTINIAGSVAQNPSQEYHVVYDFVTSGIQLVFPATGTILTPGERTTIAWDSYGTPANAFNLQYSADGGSSWTNIRTNISTALRTFTWNVPTLPTDKAMVRLTKSGTTLTSTSGAFTIIGTPVDTLQPAQCEGYINIGWQPVTGATDYEVFLLRGSEMASVATTTATSYSFQALSKDSTYWVGVRARINGKAGWRSTSISRQPNAGTCSGSLSDNDLKIAALVAPLTGRKGTASELNTAAVQVQIKNLDDAPITGFTVQYNINGRAWVSENVAAAISAGDSYIHTFSNVEDFSAVGSYTIKAVVKAAADVVSGNDTLITTIRQLDNPVLDLSVPFLDDFENTGVATYSSTIVGLDSTNRYDFSRAAYGRLRTFVNSGVAFSGNKALAVDADRYLYPSNSLQYLTGTYNLAAYQAGTNDVRLQFNSLSGSAATTSNRVWIRGSDTAAWIELYAPFASGTSPSLEVGNTLYASGQQFSSSFQVRWGVPAVAAITSQTAVGGLLLDDVSLYEVFNDMQLLQIDTPYALNCGLSSAAPVLVTLRNSSSNTLYNVPVRYRINNGAWVFENVAAVPAHTTLQYKFVQPADLSVAGVYAITAEVMCPGDSYSSNNTAAVTVFNSDAITTFPYLQNFEAGNGGWYADGTNVSWQYGTPASAKITGAASGTKAWKTTLSGHYNDNELSYLYSPCFTIAGMTKPTISFSVALDLENCGTNLCDGAWLEFSVDNQNWYNLADLTNSGTNWYKAPLHVWSTENYTTWHVATMKLPTGYNSIRFRFVLRSDAAVSREGIAIDDVHIYDNTYGIYTGLTLAAPLTQTTDGNDWSHFVSDGQLIASVLPNNQNLGNTSVQAYINTGPVRYSNGQYYMNRNITIKPANRYPASPVTVRLYFLADEADSLVNATGCATCTKPASVYELGVSKFSAANVTYENGTLSDNNNGMWSFILPADAVKVPFDKGYYAEFQVQDFSEFWFNNGSFGNNTSLPVRLLDFTARKKGTAVLLNWTTADEQDVARYEIEVARGNEDLKKLRFQKIGSVESIGNTTAQRQYTFTDNETAKNGVRYYRLKMMDNDGTFRYSEVRSVLFSDVLTWQVFPNPSEGLFYLLFQAGADEALQVQVTDAAGRSVKTATLRATGFVQKIAVDLTAQPPGMYLLQVRRQTGLQQFKLYKP